MKKRILLMDSDPAVRDALAKVLQESDYSVIVAVSGQDVLKRFVTENVDLLILDFSQPTKNGWDAFEQIANENSAIPIIIITDEHGEYDDLAVAVGVGARMEKPFDAEQLLETIARLLAEPKESRRQRLLEYSCDLHHVPVSGAIFLNTILKKLREQHMMANRFTLT